MSALWPIISLLVLFSFIFANGIPSFPHASSTIPGTDSPPSFLASCRGTDLFYYNVWDTIYIYNLSTGTSSSIYDAEPGRFISYMAPSCTPNGVLYFALSDVADPLSLPTVFYMRSITRRVSTGPTPFVTQTSTYPTPAEIPSTTTSPPFLVVDESAYYLSLTDGNYTPVKVTHVATTTYLWATGGHPRVNKMFADGVRTTMTVARDVFSFTIRDGNDIYLALANTSLSRATPIVLDRPGEFISESTALGRNFATEIFPSSTTQGIEYCFFATTTVAGNYTVAFELFRIASLSNPSPILVRPGQVTFPEMYNASRSDIIRDKFDAIPVFGNTAFFIGIGSAIPSKVMALDLFGTSLPRSVGSIPTAVAQAPEIHKISSGFILVYSNSSYRIEANSVTFVPLGGSGVTLAPHPYSLCNDELIYSAAPLVGNSNPFYHIFTTGLSASLPQGPKVSTKGFNYPAPMAVDDSSDSCVFSYWNETNGWTFARFNRAADVLNDQVRIIRRVSPTSVNLLPGSAQPQSAIVLCRPFSGLIITLETARDTERFSRFLYFVNESAENSITPRALAPDGEIEAVRLSCRAGVASNETTFYIAELEDSRFAYYSDAADSIDSFGAQVGIISNTSSPYTLYGPSLVSLNGGFHCFVASQRAETPNAFVFCFNGTDPRFSIVRVADVSSIYGYSSPSSFTFQLKVGNFHYISAGVTVIRISQSATDVSSISVVSFVPPNTAGEIDYMTDFQGIVAFMIRNGNVSSTCLFRTIAIAETQLCPIDSDPVDFTRSSRSFFLVCKSRGSPQVLTLWTTRALDLFAQSNFTLVDSHTCISSSFCQIYFGNGAPDYLIYSTFDQHNYFAFKTAYVPLGAAPSITLVYNSTSGSEVARQPRLTGPGLGSLGFAYFDNNGRIYLSDGIDHLILMVDARDSFNPPRIFRTADSYLRFHWNPRRRAQRDTFGRVKYTEGFCWTSGHCAPSFTCLRPRCVGTASNCPQPPPSSTAVCTITGWAQNGNLILGGSNSSSNSSLSSAPSSPQIIVISTNLTVSGNLIVQGSNSTPIVVQFSTTNATISVSGCLSVSGASLSIVIDPNVVIESNFTAITFDGGYCDDTQTRFETVVVQQDSTACQRPVATPLYKPTSLDIIIQFNQDACAAPSAAAALDSGFQSWMIGAIVGGISALIIIILVIMFVFRKKIIPAHKMASGAKKQFRSAGPDQAHEMSVHN